MANDTGIQTDLFYDEELDDKLLSDSEYLFGESLSSSPGLHQPQEEEEEVKNEDLPPELHDQIDENLHINENKEEDDLIQFITKARQQGFNCLDLSKKNIPEFPATLLQFPSLHYLYLEGNQLTKLPDDLFLQLPNLKWIDLRNNRITEIPIDGLAKHNSLRYLLLAGNLIRTLPIELGKVKGLSVLNLDGNPLDYPPPDIVKQGMKAIQQYLRDEYILHATHAHEKLDSDDENYNEEQQMNIVPDVWASSDEDNDIQRRMARKTKTTPKQNNLPTKTISNDPVGEVYAARAQEEQRLIRLKHQNIKITEKLEKVKSKELLHEWKEDYRSNQQQLRRKRLVKGKDYQEAVVQAPFGIDRNYISVMNKDQQEMVEKAVKFESRRNRSPESAMQEEEERRIRDRQIQARIREITGKMLERRDKPRGNASEEKRQAELELRELRKLESEVRQRRTQINNRFKAYTGDVKARKKL